METLKPGTTVRITTDDNRWNEAVNRVGTCGDMNKLRGRVFHIDACVKDIPNAHAEAWAKKACYVPEKLYILKEVGFVWSTLWFDIVHEDSAEYED